MRVRENDGVDLFRREGKCLILLLGLGAMSLKHPEVEDDGLSTDSHQMARAGDLLRRAEECDLHGGE
jgi:hypothetical protein